MVSNFYDLDVYKRSYQAALTIHQETENLPKSEQYSLSDQMRRASRSICANLAEGFAKNHSSGAEFKRFISIAIGSSNEMLVWLDFCQDLEYLNPEIVNSLKQEYTEIGRMLYKLSQNWIVRKKAS